VDGQDDVHDQILRKSYLKGTSLQLDPQRS
jgi:hypothetical protein